MKFLKIFFIFSIIISTYTKAKLVEYDLTIDYLNVNFTGKTKKAMSINGQIPAPTISATVGDTLRVTFHNHMNTETSIHWHGILLPNDQDGVPYLTTPPIKAHSSFTYEYPITHAGTYWYHSHTGLQEQKGLYGALVFHPQEGEDEITDQDNTIVLSDWIDENTQTVWSNLKRDGDYYMLKKGTVQSWLGVLTYGKQAIKNRFNTSMQRMSPMDISDIGYDAFLANGQKKHLINAKPGETIRLRIINAASASYFNVEYAGGPMKIVALDGVDIEPFEVKRFLIAIAETYDVIITIPHNKAYELRASSEDGIGYSSVILGNGPIQYAPTIPKPNLYLRTFKHHAMHNKKPIDHNNTKTDHKNHIPSNNNHTMHNNPPKKHTSKPINYKDNYQNIKAKTSTSFSKKIPVRDITLNLTGNMERYQWSMNYKPLSKADSILIKKGEVVRFKMINKTMMHHPMHLHGHFFRVLNGQGEYSPLKHTVNVPAMDQVTIEFLASEDSDWFFHCHNLYHMMSGFARVISYQDTTTFTNKTLEKLAHDQKWFFSTDTSFASNMMFGFVHAWNFRNSVELEYDFNYKKEFEIETLYRRNLSRYVDIYAGVNFLRECENQKTRKVGVFGR